jgi:hypothetical protein
VIRGSQASGASGAEGPKSGHLTAKRDRPSKEIAQTKQNRPAKGRSPKPLPVAYAPLNRLISLARPKPRPAPAQPDPESVFEIGRIGTAWSILRFSDATKKRALGQCLSCGIVREITVVGDDPPSCGCAGSRHLDTSVSRSDFASLSFIPGLKHRTRSS